MNVDLNVSFTPEKLKAFSRNEVKMDIIVSNLSETNTYWGECEIIVASPLSLAHDIEMNSAKTRIGILKPTGKMSKAIRLYTRPNNYPDDYKFSITAYIYDEDGAIAERFDKKFSVPCVPVEDAKPPLQDKVEKEKKG